MTKVLVTGGAGFIGSHAVDRLLRCGYDVRVLDIKSPNEALNIRHCAQDVEYYHGDIRKVSDCLEAAKDCRYVLHYAAEVSVPKSIADPAGTYETNVVGSYNVFQAAKRYGVWRTVYASSAAVFGDTTVVPTPEQVPHVPLSPYGEHKSKNEADASLWAQEFDIAFKSPFVGLRFFNVFGSRQDPSSPYSGVISIFADRMKQGKQPTIFGDGSATRDFIHVQDVVDVCVSMIASEKPKSVYNVAHGQSISLIELVATLNEVLGTRLEPVLAEPRSGDISHSRAETSYLDSDLPDRKRTNFRDGLLELITNQAPSI